MNGHREVPVTDGTASKASANHSNINPYDPYTTDEIYDDGLNRYGWRVGKATTQAETMVGNLWNHIRMSTRPADAAVARIVQGAKILKDGRDKVFQQKFGFIPGERLLKSSACYISTTTGPVNGTLYISTKRLAFCSDYPVSWQHQSIDYKLDQVSTVGSSTNILNPTEKYIHVVTVDGCEFYFMGFISYDKALKSLNEALQLHDCTNGNRRIQVQ